MIVEIITIKSTGLSYTQNIPFWIDITTDGSASWSAPLTSGGRTLSDDSAISMQVSIAFKPGVPKPLLMNQANGYTGAGVVATGTATPHPLGAAIPTSETNTALLRAASAIKLLTGKDPSSTDPVFAPIKGFLLT